MRPAASCALIADKAFDANAIVAHLDAHGAKIVIPKHSGRTSPRTTDGEMYKLLRQAQAKERCG